jgi:hypothetical protein
MGRADFTLPLGATVTISFTVTREVQLASELRILGGYPVLNLAQALRLLGESGEIRRCADSTENEARDGGPALHLWRGYWIALPVLEKTVFALEPIIRIVPSAMINTTASMTEYSATSWPSSLDHNRLSE